VAANVVLFLLNEINKLKQMWLFLNVLYVTVWSLIKFHAIIVLHVIGREGRFNTENTRL